MSKTPSTQAEVIASLLIKQIEEGTAPWQKPWDPTKCGSPHNGLTGSAYKGANALYLAALQTVNGYDDPRWMTYKQAQSIGAQVRKGEKSATIIHYKFEQERKVKQPDGSVDILKEKLTPPRAFPANVFNASQIDGLEPYKAPEITWNSNERAESLLSASGAKIEHDAGDRAWYSPVNDDIHLPDRAAFPDESRYYSTALHELGHWTGHATRLDRDLSGRFGSESYAKEELRAEIASMLIANETGVPNEPHNNAAYVKSWVKALKDDPTEITRAARDAELISRYVLNFEHTLEKDLQQETKAADLESRLDRLAADPMIYSIEKEGNHLMATWIGDTGLGEGYQSLENGLFLAGRDDTVDNSRWMMPVAGKTLLHGMGSNAKDVIESTLESAPAKQSLFVFGDEDTKKALKEHYPRVHVMTPKDISYGAKSFREAIQDKGIEQTKRVIEQTRYGSQSRWERVLDTDKAQAKEIERESVKSVTEAAIERD
ncbi:zincin-like metallopeptidase domain-containing protein [Enterobacter ludwigii]